MSSPSRRSQRIKDKLPRLSAVVENMTHYSGVDLPPTYVDCGEQGSLKAVVSNRNLLEAQQAVDEQGLESSQEFPSVELGILMGDC